MKIVDVYMIVNPEEERVRYQYYASISYNFELEGYETYADTVIGNGMRWWSKADDGLLSEVDSAIITPLSDFAETMEYLGLSVLRVENGKIIQTEKITR